MKTKHKIIVLGALIVIFCSCAVVLVILLHVIFGFGVKTQAPSSSQDMTQVSKETVSAEITIHSAVGLEEESQDTLYTQIPSSPLPQSKAYNAMPMQQGKDSLKEEALISLYEKIEEKVYYISEQKNEEGFFPMERITVRNAQLTDVQVVQALSAFLHDHPEVFWVSNQYGYSTTESKTTVQLYSVIAPGECVKISKRLSSEIQSTLQSVPEGTSALDREIYLYDTLIQKCDYDKEAAQDDSNWRAHSIVGVFLDGQAVCEGYARALQLLLNQSGIPSMLVTGTAEGAHMWNLVRIDGQWYHADPTWDDNGEYAVHQYLNLSDSMIQQDHTLYPTVQNAQKVEANKLYNLPLPSCTAVKANYFRSKAVPLDNDAKALTQALKKAAQKREKRISIYVGEDTDYQQAVTRLFLESPYQFLYSVRQANLEAEHPIRYDGCSYVEADISRGIVVLLDYE